jgi:hypothetical protein
MKQAPIPLAQQPFMQPGFVPDMRVPGNGAVITRPTGPRYLGPSRVEDMRVPGGFKKIPVAQPPKFVPDMRVPGGDAKGAAAWLKKNPTKK